MKTCYRCKTEKPTADFWRNRRTKDGLQDACKPCSLTAQRDRGARRRAGQQPTDTVAEKHCRACDTTKPVDAFRRDSRTRDGLQWLCGSCAWERIRFSKYGLTQRDYDALVAAQNGRCAICDTDGVLVIDHDHETGQVRGLLCHRCNVGIGRFGDSPELLIAAFAYVQGAAARQMEKLA